MPGRPILWLAFLGGALAWSAHLLASYPLVPFACESGSTTALNLVTLAALLLAGTSAAAGAWGLRTLGRAPGGSSTAATASAARAAGATSTAVAGSTSAAAADGSSSTDTAVRRARFMARFGLGAGLFFLFVIAVQGLPPLLQDPCLAVG